MKKTIFVLLSFLFINSINSQKPKPTLPKYNWQQLNTEPYKGKQDDIFFIDENNGWYGNGAGKIFHTTDGGNTWKLQLERKGFYVRCLAFTDSLHGYAGNIGTDYFPGVTDTTCMLTTTDGGATWQEINNITGPYPKGLCAIDVYKKMYINAGKPAYKNIIRAAGRVGSPSFLLSSYDEGKTWTSEKMDAYTAMIFDIHFTSIDTGYICGASDADVEKSNALILQTTNAGKTWHKVYQSNRPFELTWKCSFPTKNVGYVTLQSYNEDSTQTQRYVVKTTNAGKNWQEIKLANNYKIREFGIGFIDNNIGWVGTTLGGYLTTNGGKTWTTQNMGLYVNKIRIIPHNKRKTLFAIGSTVHKLIIE